ncbi:hypothetical protein CRYUN_Cryun03dG0156500 [Craigia yunnanensis]
MFQIGVSLYWLLLNVVCVYCWQLEWINEDFLSFSLECNFMQTLLLDFCLVVVTGKLFSKIITGSQTCSVLTLHCKVSADGIVTYVVAMINSV